MSGQQIGTVVGGIIGAYFGGNWQLGAAIGGMIGGAIDPTKIAGPHIGDGQSQSATDGSPISWVMGTMWVAGTIVDVGQRQEFKVKQSGGKGSGTEQYQYEAHQNFSIIVCESDELKGSTISQVLMVEQDGKIVYDVRPGSTMLADSQKWLARNCRFYYGDEAQLPIAADEGAHGVGNAPAYRGVLRAFFTQFNVTAVGDRIPNFRFLVSALNVVGAPYDAAWKYKYDPHGTADYSAVDYDDSGWSIGRGAFGQPGNASTGLGQTVNTATPYPDAGDKLWLRGMVPANPGSQLVLNIGRDNNAAIWWNGIKVLDEPTSPVLGGTQIVIPSANVLSNNRVAMRVNEYSPRNIPGNVAFASIWTASSGATTPDLSTVVSRIVARGGLTDINVAGLGAAPVLGYAIAKQMTAVDALGPLLGAHFAYASEYDGKINFAFYGADAVMTIDEDDILEANDANGDAVTANLRNNATEFPRRVIGQYYDPAQNYMPVTVMQTRRAAGVTATGDRTFDIPVVMSADQAQQTVDKALKIAYARLEGTLEFSVPFAGKDNVYLSLVAGDAVIFRGKRWIVTNPILSAGYIKLTLQYDRQSAYTSNVQAIPGLEPTPPQSRYSGPTMIVPMNLPRLQTGDTYGIYVVTYSDPHNANWRSAAIQMSLDDGATWQTVGTSNTDSVTGTLTEDGGSAGFIVQTNGDLSSVGSAQLDAQQNAAALLHGTAAEVLQYGTAEEDSGTPDLYTLSDMRRGLLGTTQIDGVAGDQFVTLDAVQLIPIDVSFAGKTIQFRAIGAGENTDDAAVVSIVYSPDMTVIHDGGVVT